MISEQYVYIQAVKDMSDYRVCKVAVAQHHVMEEHKFDNKEDAEHYAKNQSNSDPQHRYDVQHARSGEFKTIKSYVDGRALA